MLGNRTLILLHFKTTGKTQPLFVQEQKDIDNISAMRAMTYSLRK